MKTKNILVLLIALTMSGCTTNKSVGGGYYIKSGQASLLEAGGGSRSLYFKRPGGWRVKVWGYVGAVQTKDDVAVFMGNIKLARDKHSQGLFAVRGGSPLLEI